jgi:hypothetical protein
MDTVSNFFFPFLYIFPILSFLLVTILFVCRNAKSAQHYKNVAHCISVSTVTIYFFNYSEPRHTHSQNQPVKLSVALRALRSAHMWGGDSIRATLIITETASYMQA